MKYILFFVFMFFAESLHAAEYQVDHEKTKLTFSSTHAGENFTGHFKNWDADIVFDPNDLEDSKVKVVFDTSSATTQNTLYDETLPKTDWFDTDQFKQAIFETTGISKIDGEGQYSLDGILTIRNVSVPVHFDFTLSDLNKDVVTMNTEFNVMRLDFGIGQKSDPQAAWVTNEIKITIDLVAMKKN